MSHVGHLLRIRGCGDITPHIRKLGISRECSVSSPGLFVLLQFNGWLCGFQAESAALEQEKFLNLPRIKLQNLGHSACSLICMIILVAQHAKDG